MLTFLSANWWVFMGLGFAFWAAAIFSHLRTMKRTADAWSLTYQGRKAQRAKSMSSTDPPFAIPFSSFASVVVFALLGSLCELLMAIGLVVNLIDYFKGD